MYIIYIHIYIIYIYIANIYILCMYIIYRHIYTYIIYIHIYIISNTYPHPLSNQNPLVTKKFFGNAPLAMAMKF